jgi:hypothetical protein
MRLLEHFDQAAEVSVQRNDNPALRMRLAQNLCIAGIELHVVNKQRVEAGFPQRSSDRGFTQRSIRNFTPRN